MSIKKCRLLLTEMTIWFCLRMGPATFRRASFNVWEPIHWLSQLDIFFAMATFFVVLWLFELLNISVFNLADPVCANSRWRSMLDIILIEILLSSLFEFPNLTARVSISVKVYLVLLLANITNIWYFLPRNLLFFVFFFLYHFIVWWDFLDDVRLKPIKLVSQILDSGALTLWQNTFSLNSIGQALGVFLVLSTHSFNFWLFDNKRTFLFVLGAACWEKERTISFV